MRLFIFIPILLVSVFLRSQTCENFSNGDFPENSKWFGNSDLFQLTSSTAIPAEMRPALQLNGDTFQVSVYLSTVFPLQNVDTVVWEFWVKLSFTPSVNNFARFYLTSDHENPNLATTAFFVGLGESSKSITLFKQKGTVLEPLITGISLSKSTNTVRVKVKKTPEGLWRIWADTSGNRNYTLQGAYTAMDTTIFNYTGIYCKYTKSNASKMYFDDICIYPVLPDNEKPVAEKIRLEMPDKIHVYFSEEVESRSASNANNYIVNCGIGPAISVIHNYQHATLFFNPFETKKDYTLSISNVSDMQGNIMKPQTFHFMHYNIQPTDIVINEVLFHPKTNGSDFVEIYNRTSFDLDIESLKLATIDETTGKLKSCINIPDGTIIKSKDYMVFTVDTDAIKMQYYVKSPEKLIKMKSLPSYPNAEGTVILALSDSTIIDRFDYSEKMHFGLLKDVSGISLERRNQDWPTNEASNWQSASETAGWATPTYKNSQYNELADIQEDFSIFPLVFSPDNDGKDDLLNISYKFENEGAVCNATIFDSKGRIVRNLKRNALLGIEGTFAWDGITDQKQKAPLGMYIVFIETFDVQGKKKQFKKVVVLVGNR